MSTNYELRGQVSPKDVDRVSKIIYMTRTVLERGPIRRILDLGCKHGGLTTILKEVAGAEEAWGLDISDEDLKHAALRGIQVLKTDLDRDRLKFQAESFDMVTCFDVIYYLHDPDFLLEEVWRVLKPMGVFILSLRNLASWTNRISLLLGFQPYYADVSLKHSVGKLFAGRWGIARSLAYSGYVRGFTLKAITELLQMHSFETFQILGYREGNMPKGFLLLDGFFCRFPSLASGVILANVKQETRFKAGCESSEDPKLPL